MKVTPSFGIPLTDIKSGMKLCFVFASSMFKFKSNRTKWLSFVRSTIFLRSKLDLPLSLKKLNVIFPLGDTF